MPQVWGIPRHMPSIGPRRNRPDEGADPPDMAPTKNAKLLAWVEEVAALTTPDRIEWCDGSADEYDRLCQELVDAGTFTQLSRRQAAQQLLGRTRTPATSPGSRTAPSSARTKEIDAGPTNNWRDPAEMRQKLDGPLQGRHEGPHHVRGALLHGPARLGHRPHRRAAHRLGLRGRLHADHDPHGHRAPSRCSATTAPSSRACTRWARPLEPGQADVPWPCNADNKYIVHFPETREIVSYGSGYGGNALLGKKCFALRIASVMARDDGWLAEHMLILKLTSPEGETRYVAGRLPLRLRQDQPRHAHPDHRGLEGRDGRRRHLLDEVRRRRPPLRHQPRGRLLRRGAGHQHAHQPQRHPHARRQLHLHQHRH